jgi:putative ABC transport system permease protein
MRKDFRDEIEAHIALEADRLIAEGLPPAEAAAAARRKFGNKTLAEERFFEGSRWAWWNQLTQDLRYAVRSWRKAPWLTAVVIVSLALGMGANTAIFSVVNTLLVKSLPYRDADRLVYVTEYWPHEPINPGPPSPDFSNWKDHSKLADEIAAYGGGAALNLTGSGDPEHIQGTMVTSNLLDLIGTTMALGRNFTADEDTPGGNPVVILSHGMWLRKFGGSPDVLGKQITLNGVNRTVVGVLPSGFAFPDNNFAGVLMVPMALRPHIDYKSDPENFRALRVMARTRPGVSPAALKAELFQLLKANAADEPVQFVTMRKDMEVRVLPLRDWLTGPVRTMLLLLEFAVAMVLLIACLNIASLQVARAISRRREIGLRLAIGAGRNRLLRQFLTESILLSLVAGALGVSLAYASLGVMRRFLPSNLHLADLVRIDRDTLLFTFVLCVASGVVTGLIPLFSALRPELTEALGDGGCRAGMGRMQNRMHSGLVIAEVAAAMVLLTSAALLIRTFVRQTLADPGFDPNGVLTLKVAPSPRRYPNGAKRIQFYRNLLERAGAIPGVEAAGIGGGLPLTGTLGAAGVSFKDRPQPPLGGRPTLPTASVSSGYFRALGIRLLRGRLFTDADREGAPLVAIVNEAFAREFFPGEDALGKQIEVASREGHWREIVGIVGNVKQQGRRPVDPFLIYTPLSDAFEPETYLILKSRANPDTLVSAASSAVHEIDANEPVFDVSTLEDRLGDSLSGPRSNMLLIGLLAALALLLAALGIFGVVSYFVGRRAHEIGVRMALGASESAVLKMVLGRGLALTLAGIAGGLLAALWLTRSFASLIEGVTANDPMTFALAAFLFTGIAMVACFLPARWASRVDPAVALRHE